MTSQQRKSTIKVIQVNLNHCWAAQQLLTQTAYERSTDIFIVSDYHHKGDDQSWATSTDGGCAILLPNSSKFIISSRGAGVGYVWVQVEDLLLYSCYCPPRWSILEFETFLDSLDRSMSTHDIRGTTLIVAGDFNSHSEEWSSGYEDTRGALLSNFASGANLILANHGSAATYSRVNASAVIDVTFARPRPDHWIKNWTVLSDIYSASDHFYIEFDIETATGSATKITRRRAEGWAIGKLSMTALNEYLEAGNHRAGLQPVVAAESIKRLQKILVEACDASMPRRTIFEGRKSAHWWNSDIAELRRKAIRARRAYQRAGRRPGSVRRTLEHEAYQEARTQLKTAIRKAQETSWRELCNAVNNDPWGVPYRVVMKKLGRKPNTMDSQRLTSIARGLFPAMPAIDWSNSPYIEATIDSIMNSGEEPAAFNAAELERAINKLPCGKAPGPDHIPNEVIKAVATRCPDIFLETYNACLDIGYFPDEWKKARLVLLSKGTDKPPDQPSSYRPISLLDGAGKVLERMLLNRLDIHIEAVDALSNNQFGFRRSRSTIDATNTVIRIAKAANSGAVQNRNLCAVISLDVKNAFNTAPWSMIDAALQRAAVPQYLIKILRSYMSNRWIQVGDAGHELAVMGGIPQGSVLGPTLWNLFYDSLLRTQVPRGVSIIAFADDVAVVGVAHNSTMMEELVNPVLTKISRWMNTNGLSLAPAKSECVLLTTKNQYSEPKLTISGHQIPVVREMRYLGIRLDTRLSFMNHVKSVAAGARRTASALGRLMPNVGGPAQGKRTLLMTVVQSRLLYGAEVWADEICKTQKAKNLITQSQRCAALRIARCFRTVSDAAALVIARMPPGHLLALERKRVTEWKAVNQGPVPRGAIRKETICQWNNIWLASTKAQWTRRLIPDLIRWWYFGPKTTSYHMAQVLTGHGCFQEYLFTKGRALAPTCVHCLEAIDNVEHTIFQCTYWDYARDPIKRTLGRGPLPEDVKDFLCVPNMDDLPNEEHQRRRILDTFNRLSSEFREMVEVIMTKKEQLERERQNNEQRLHQF